jgi:transposase InsO family protein
VYLHTAVDAHTRLAYTEPLLDEKASTAMAFLHRARAWFAAHGITRIERLVTIHDNGACYRADAFSRALLDSCHQRIRPYTPRHNGKVERYNRILAEDFLYAHTWTSETSTPKRWRCGTSTTTTTDSTPPSADDLPQEQSGRPSPTSWPHTRRPFRLDHGGFAGRSPLLTPEPDSLAGCRTQHCSSSTCRVPC